MVRKMMGLLTGLVLVAGLTTVGAAPAFAIATDACHIAKDLTEPIAVSEGNTQAVGYLYWNECSRAKFGWSDAQRVYVPAGRNVRSWISYGGPWVLRGTWTATGWHRTSDYCGTGCWLSVTYD